MAGILDYFSQLFGQGQPALAGAPAPNAPTAPVQDPQQPQGMLAGLSPDQVSAMIAKARPGVLGTLLAGFSHPGGFNQVRDEVTKENIARQLLPQTIALQQQGIAYGQSIKDPAMRELYFNDRPAYAKIMETRMGAHDTAAGAITTGLGANGDQAVNGSLVTKPGDTIGDVGGGVVQHNKAAPIVLGPSQSAADGETAQILSTAPAAPQVLTTKEGEGVHVVNPNGDGGGGAPPAAAGAPSVAGAQAPRGIRNNNPWNLTNLGKGLWQGQLPGAQGRDGDMAVFSTPEAGAAAADRNMLAKYSLHGLNTLQGVIADPHWGWDPGNQAYVQTVSADLGIPAGAPLNLADPSVRARVLNSMKKVELGKFASSAPSAPGSTPAGPSGQPAPAAAGGGHGTVRTVIEPTAVRQATPQEVIASGRPPGAYQIHPDGSWSLLAQPNKDELSRVTGMVQAAQAMEDVTNIDQQFLKLNKRTMTGPHLGGGPLNVVGDLAESLNGDLGTMGDLESRETLAFRPQGIGRILQSEIPMFRAQALSTGRLRSVNESIAQEHAESARMMREKANFYQDYMYRHGNLAGADQAWAAQQGGKQGSGASSTPAQKSPQPKGWQIHVVQQ